MHEKRLPFTRIGIVALVVLFLTLDSTPSVPSVLAPVTPPDPQEIVLLHELQAWLLGSRSEIGSLDEPDLVAAIRRRPRSFELFRRYPSPEVSREFVRGLPFGGEIAGAAERFGVDPLLIAAVVAVESGFDAQAVSPKGAAGLMQITAGTVMTFGGGDALEPRHNLEIGVRYFRRLLRRYDGDLELTLAAYNAGPGNVRRFAGVPPFPETRRYVEKVLSQYLEHCREAWQAEGADRLLDLG